MVKVCIVFRVRGVFRCVRCYGSVLFLCVSVCVGLTIRAEISGGPKEKNACMVHISRTGIPGPTMCTVSQAVLRTTVVRKDYTRLARG